MKVYFNDNDTIHVYDNEGEEYVIDYIEFFDNQNYIVVHLVSVDDEELTDSFTCCYLMESVHDALEFWGYEVPDDNFTIK